MRVLAIRGCNLASLAGEFAVELESDPLAGAGLFAITGPTGAGKSTLLDALCLALYDTTPRLSRRGGVPIGAADLDEELRLSSNDVRSLLRRGTGEGWAEVEFIGRDGRRYRARWAVRRARRRPDGRFQPQEMELQDLGSGHMLGGTRTETLQAIRERVGLDFDQFCRSVLLAQNDFAAFLGANADKRAELLESMTGTEIYRQLSVAAHRRWSDERRELEARERQAAEQQVLEPGARAALEIERGQRAAAVTEARARLALAEEAERCVRRVTEVRTAVDGLALAEATARTEVQAAAAALATTEARLAGARDSLREAEPALAAAAELDAELGGVRTRLRDATGALEAASVRHRRLADSLRRIDGDHRRATAEVLAGYAVVREARTELADKAEAAGQQARQAGAALRQVREHLAQAGAAAERAEQAAAAQPLAAARAALDDLRERRDQLRLLAQAGAAARRAVTATERCRQLAEAATAARAAATVAEAGAGDSLAGLEIKLGEARRAFDRLRLAVDLVQHRDQLDGGEPCPLCGATEHPWATEAPVQSLLAGERERLAGLEAERAGLEAARAAARAEVQARDRELEAAGRDRAAAAAELAAARADWRAGLERLGELALIGDPADAQARDAVESRLQALDQRIEAAAQVVREAAHLEELRAQAVGKVTARQHDLDQARDRADEAVRRQQAVERELADAVAAQERAAAAARTIAGDDAERGRPDGPAADWRTRAAALERTVERVAELRAQRQAEAAQLAERADEVAACTAARDRLQAELGSLTDRRRAYFDGAPVDDTRRRLQAAIDAAEIARAEAAATHGRAAEILASAGARLESARQAVAEAEAASAAAQAGLAQRLGEATAGLEQLRQAVEAAAEIESRVAVQLELDDRARARRAQLQAEALEQRRRAGAYQVVAELIGHHDGASFRRFAQSLTLDALLAHANEHLRELAPRYRLQRVPGHDLDLQIVDGDMGDEVRGVNSLSGGESFLVSLALALGLSSLSARDVRVESLLIDEGFGTLDPDTLEVALSVLDALQASGRKVGLISHVPGLAERIGVRVVVEKRGGGRSAVSVAGP